MKIFLGHHDVRFAQHLIQLCQAVLDNVHWQAIIDAPSRKYKRHEQEKARGFINLWKACSHQMWLTAVMVDVCSVFRYVEKETQKEEIIIPDILHYRDIALEQLKLIADKLFPGLYISFSSFHIKCLMLYFLCLKL